MAYRGAGAPLPRRSGGSGGRPLYHLTEEVNVKSSDGTEGPGLKMVKALKLRPGATDHPILTLDDFTSLDEAYSVNLHMFNLKGTKDNIVVCPMTHADQRSCPICQATGRGPSWYVCLTGIDRKEYSFDEGKNAGKVYTDLRRLVLVTQTWIQRMTKNAEKAKGWRGSLWEVSRSKPTEETRDGRTRMSFKDSPRIGDMWFFKEKFDEERLRAEFEKAASVYGLVPEKFIQPLDYEKVLRPKNHEQLMAIANEIKQEATGLKSPPSDDDDRQPVASSAPSDDEAESEINY